MALGKTFSGRVAAANRATSGSAPRRPMRVQTAGEMLTEPRRERRRTSAASELLTDDIETQEVREQPQEQESALNDPERVSAVITELESGRTSFGPLGRSAALRALRKQLGRR